MEKYAPHCGARQICCRASDQGHEPPPLCSWGVGQSNQGPHERGGTTTSPCPGHIRKATCKAPACGQPRRSTREQRTMTSPWPCHDQRMSCRALACGQLDGLGQQVVFARAPVLQNDPSPPTPHQGWYATLTTAGWRAPFSVRHGELGRDLVQPTCPCEPPCRLQAGGRGCVRGFTCQNCVSAHRPSPLTSAHWLMERKRELPKIAIFLRLLENV